MANKSNDDVIIVGSLSDKELRDSIDKLVNYVGNQTSVMASNFVVSMDLMKGAMKDFAITQKVSVDLMQDAWKQMSVSFDAMLKAQQAAYNGNGGSGSTGGGSGKPTYGDDTVGKLQEIIALEEKRRKDMKLGSDELRTQNKLIEEQKAKLKSETTSDQTKAAQAARKELQAAFTLPARELADAEKKLKELQALSAKFNGKGILDPAQWNRLQTQIQATREKIDKLRQKKPASLQDVLGMDESSFDAITKKMAALKKLSWSDSIEQKRIIDEYQRLRLEQNKLMASNARMTHSNNYLAQSFGYIRNRIVYALTLGAVTNFTKQVYEIRGQYELLERSLGILIDDMRKGSEMFNELNQMALKSPFTLMELATGTKQLLAYNFAEEEVVDTTRRLADISAALGVPMERLVYNLGQIKAQTALTARDARDFANAGLAIVPMLAQMYTEEKRFGEEIVTTAQVFDMMSKKMVTYSDVIKVINKITDEGGKFFDFQAKQADTLRVKMANLTLAWNNMLNEIGQDNQGVLELPLRGLKILFENWRALVAVIKEVVIMFGAYKAAAMVVSLWNQRLAIQGAITAFFELAKSVKSAKDAMTLFSIACKANPIGLIASAIAAAVGYFYLFNNSMNDAIGYVEKFGRAGAKVVNDTEALFDTLKGISKESSNYKVVMGELNNILQEYGLEAVNESDGIDVLNEKRRIAISLIKEETLERKHLNDVQQARDEYASTVEEARNKMRSQLKEAVTGMYGFVSGNQELRQNASAIANIISDVVEQNITLIAGKTGDEYEKGVQKIYNTIQQRMRDIGISESTISKQWLDDTLFLKNDIVGDFIGKIKNAKEAQDQYIESIDKAYEAEKKATEGGADFNDRVEQTQTQLMKAANDTDNFYKKIDKLIKDYSGLNIIDFLVKVKTEVPVWMSQKGLTELTQLSARFTALATQAKKAGRESLNVNGKDFSVQQLFERAAQYAQAAQNKQADIESRKSTTITREASEALKEYKSALEAVNVAKNRQKQGTADQALVTEKETEAQKAYNKALEKGVSLDELRKAKDNGRSSSKKDQLGDALEKEIQLVSDMQKLYKEYQKAGVDADKARIASAKEYEKTLQSTNAKLQRYGIKGLTGDKLTAMGARDLREYYLGLRDIANLKGNTKGVEALEKAIHSLNIEITKGDYKKFTDSLNNDLAKVKDEYELAVEFDANPELGDIFADMMGISKDELAQLPRTFDDVVKRLQSKIDALVGDNAFNLLDMLNSKKFDDWVKNNGKDPNSEMVKSLKAYVTYANKVRQDETKKQVEEWDKLLEKYAEYEYKRKQIEDTYRREMETARKNGAGADILKAITRKRDQSLAQLDFDEYQRSPEWITATGNIADLTAVALGKLIKGLEKYKKEAKNLDPKQIKKINQALEALYKQQRKGNPFHVIADAIAEAKERMDNYTPTINEYEQKIKELEEEEKRENGLSQDKADKLKKLREELKRLKEEQAAVGKVSATTIVDGINSAIAVAQQASTAFSEMAEALGGKKMTEAAKTISDITGILEKGGQGAAAGAQIGGGYGAIIGAAAGVLQGVITTYADKWSGNADITEQVEDSVLAVKRLENAYKLLEDAADEAYGITEIGAKRAAIANKELQLTELKRQLQLEESRKEKNRDESKIEDLKGQIVDLELEIKNATKEIANNLLDISSVGDAAENLVSQMIEAFKKGEDYMGKYADTFSDMIDNMIMKAIVGQVIGQRMEELFKKVEDTAIDRANKVVLQESELFDEVTARWVDEYGQAHTQERTIGEWRREIEKYLSANLTDEGRKKYEAAFKKLNELYEQEANVTPSDVSEMRNMIDGWKNSVKTEFDMWMEAFGVQFGQDRESSGLSSLQQGIQGVTEDTAGAIEGYMNIVAQRVFEQNLYLQEIRDHLNNFDLDVQLVTLSQMLLQLQQSYQVQQNIEMILNGVLTPNGRAFVVELNS